MSALALEHCVYMSGNALVPVVQLLHIHNSTTGEPPTKKIALDADTEGCLCSS